MVWTNLPGELHHSRYRREKFRACFPQIEGTSGDGFCKTRNCCAHIPVVGEDEARAAETPDRGVQLNFNFDND
jgi:hypothetical protein